MDSKEKATKKALIGLEKLDETFDYILESSKEELTKYLENEQNIIDIQIEKLKNRIEDLILTYLNGPEISEAEEELIESREADEELKKVFIQTIYSELVYKIIYQIILNTDEEKIKEIARNVINANNINESAINVKENIYDIYENIFSNFSTNKTMQYLHDLIFKKSAGGKGVVVKIDSIKESLDDDDYKFQA